MNNKKYVYGLAYDNGEIIEFLWKLGVLLTEEEAYEHFKDYIEKDKYNSYWLEEVEIIS